MFICFLNTLRFFSRKYLGARERAIEKGRKGRDWYFWLGQSTFQRHCQISADMQALGEDLESHSACSSDVFEIQWLRKGSPSSKDHRGWPVPLPLSQTANTFLAEDCLPARRWKSMT